MSSTDLESMVPDSEKILWRGVPNKRCFILEAVFNPLLPFAILWAIIDLGVFGVAFSSGGDVGMLIPFMLLHMMPVWIYLAGLTTIALKYKHEAYIITNRAVYASHGIFSMDYDTKLFADMSKVNVHRGVFDQMLDVGDVIVTDDKGTVCLIDLGDFESVFKMVKRLQEDVYSDV